MKMKLMPQNHQVWDRQEECQSCPPLKNWTTVQKTPNLSIKILRRRALTLTSSTTATTTRSSWRRRRSKRLDSRRTLLSQALRLGVYWESSWRQTMTWDKKLSLCNSSVNVIRSSVNLSFLYGWNLMRSSLAVLTVVWSRSFLMLSLFHRSKRRLVAPTLPSQTTSIYNSETKARRSTSRLSRTSQIPCALTV